MIYDATISFWVTVCFDATRRDSAIDYKKEGRIAIFPYLSPFLIVWAPGGIGAFWVVTCSAPVPFATITQEYIHS